MEIKYTFIKELSLKIKVIKMTRNEIRKELKALRSDVSEQSYKAWVLETFVPSVNILYEYILEKSHGKGVSDTALDLKEAVYKRILRINDLIDPENLYIDIGNSITLTKGKWRLVEADTWSEKHNDSDLVVMDLYEFFEVADQARGYDHTLEAQTWPLLNKQIKVRIFSKTLKESLVFGLDPESKDDIKYFVVATCIDSFHQLYKFLDQNPDTSHIPFSKIISTLYDIAIKHNPFLDLTVKDIKRINKNTRQQQAGTKEEDTAKTLGRQSLAKVPRKDILHLEETLKDRLFGQEKAVEAVCNAVKRAYLGLKLRNKPIGSFLFYGPTSTGKTELAKALADVLIKSVDEGIITVPCGSTLQSSSGINTLIGAPPSYVGYEEGGALAKALKTGKFKILLFDEVDKADERLFDLVLEMLEEGRIMAADGSTLDVKECVIIFTSNIGQDEANRAMNSPGFESQDTIKERENLTALEYEKTMKKKLKPEFLARLTGHFFFGKLSEENLIKTSKLHLDRYKKEWTRKIKFEFSDDVPALIVEKCKEKYKAKFHARDIKDYIDAEIVQKLGDFIIEKEVDFKKLERVELDIEDKEFIFNLIKKIPRSRTANKTSSKPKAKRRRTA